jgi:UDP-N-acetylglucosamine 1-carboxyvinyltransferase
MSNLLKIPINQKLSGEVEISGAKNAILPILAASLLSDEEIILKNVPDLSDVHVKLKLLENLGSKSHFDPKTKTIIIFRKNKNDINPFQIDHDESKKIRTSTLLMGPLLSRWSICRIFEDGGGCNLGKRALDLHIKFLKILNSEEFYDDSRKSYFLKSKSSRLKGNEKDIDFENRISVGATQNLIMAGVLAEGKTIIRGAASEPEIINLCVFL